MPKYLSLIGSRLALFHRSERVTIAVRAALGLLFLGVIATACTTDEPESATDRRRTGPPVVTMPHRQTTTTLPPGAGGPTGTTGPTEAVAPAWWIQYGGPGDDQAHGIDGYGNAVYVVGDSTELDAAAPGGLDATLAIIRSDGELIELTQSLDPSADSARTIALRSEAPQENQVPSTTLPETTEPTVPPTTIPGTTGPPTTVPGSDAGILFPSLAMACGDKLVADPNNPLTNAISQGWCSTVNQSGNFESTQDLSATSLGSIRSMIFSPDGRDGYVIGDLFHNNTFDPEGRDYPDTTSTFRDSLVMRTDAHGTPTWLRQLGQDGDDRSLGVCLTDLGDAVVVGSTTGWLAAEPAGRRDAWISRFDPSGNQRWAVQIGTSEDEVYTDVGLAGEARMGTEAFLATGYVSLPAPRSDNTESDDDGQSSSDVGGTASDDTATEDTPSANTDGSDVPTDVDEAHYDAILHAFGPDGGLLWQVEFGESGDEFAHAIYVDGNTAYVVGTTTSEDFGEPIDDIGPGGGTDGFLAAIDVATGEPRWVARFGTEEDETITGITATDDGLLVISGHTSGALNDHISAGGTDAFAIAFPLPAAGGGAARAV